MVRTEIYTKVWCPFCSRAKALLKELGVEFREIDVTTDIEGEREMVQRSGRTSVPQIFVNDHHVGGSDDLAAAVASGDFDRLLAGTRLDSAVRQEYHNERA